MNPAPPTTTRYGEVLAHGTNLNVAYTNDSAKVAGFLSDFTTWLGEAREQEKFMGLDLEYTDYQLGVAVIQLCFKKRVMVFQSAR